MSAALAAKMGSNGRVAEAADGDTIRVGQAFTGSNSTTITTTNVTALIANASSSPGIIGTSATSSGVYGQTAANNQAGVFGVNTAGGFAVSGNAAAGTGIAGFSSTGIGMSGVSASGQGVYGEVSNAAGTAVFGSGGPGVGVRGVSVSNTGCYGSSSSGIGVIGTSTTSIGVYGAAPTGTFAGQFDGKLRVNGDFEATGMKSAVIELGNGQLSRVYCMESPDSWFEDFGGGTLAGGWTTVKIDPSFASIVHLESGYHVFLTPLGECKGLSVIERTPTQFTVRELGAGVSSVSFSYRLVARRRDVTTSRFQSIQRTETPNTTRSSGSEPRAPKPLANP